MLRKMSDVRFNAILLKLNQIGTYTETIKTIELAKSNDQIRKFNLMSSAKQTSILGKVGEGITNLKEKVIDHIQVVKDNTTATTAAQTNNSN